MQSTKKTMFFNIFIHFAGNLKFSAIIQQVICVLIRIPKVKEIQEANHRFKKPLLFLIKLMIMQIISNDKSSTSIFYLFIYFDTSSNK